MLEVLNVKKKQKEEEKKIESLMPISTCEINLDD